MPEANATLLALATDLYETSDIARLIGRTLLAANELIPAERHSIGMLVDNGENYRIYAVRGAGAAESTGMLLAAADFPFDLAALARGDAIVAEAPTPPDAFTPASIRQRMAVPLFANNVLLGTLNIGRSTPNSLGQHEVEQAGRIAGIASLALKRRDEERLLHDAHEAALEASQAKSRFLANMSHEIRTPLNAILGLSELLSDRLTEPENAHFARTINESATGLLALINAVLDFSKGSTEAVEIHPEPVDIGDLAHGVVRILDEQAQKSGLSLRASVANSVPDEVLVDPLRLRQVLLNLVGNALKFTRQGSVQVVVDATPGPDFDTVALHISISDTGVGLSEAEQSTIFDPFVQAQSTRGMGGGTGLGLAISKQILQAMGGDLTVQSTVGVGTRFDLRFPAVVHDDEDSQDDPTFFDDSDSIRVLVVEDNPVNQMVARAMLEKLGHTVAIACNGIEALARLRSDPYTLVFMDCQMPEMDGYEATVRIRSGQGGVDNTRLPIVALTANALPEDRDKCLKAGMDDYVSKPLTSDALQRVIGRWSGRQHSLAPASRRV